MRAAARRTEMHFLGMAPDDKPKWTVREERRAGAQCPVLRVVAAAVAALAEVGVGVAEAVAVAVGVESHCPISNQLIVEKLS